MKISGGKQAKSWKFYNTSLGIKSKRLCTPYSIIRLDKTNKVSVSIMHEPAYPSLTYSASLRTMFDGVLMLVFAGDKKS